MAENVFGNLSLSPAPERRSDRAEPRLFPVSRTLPADPPIGDPGAPARIADPRPPIGIEGQESVLSPTLSVTDRLTLVKAEPSAGTLLSLALVGLVATAIIGAFFSVGLLLLSAPARQNLASSAPVSAHLPAPAPPDTGTPRPLPANTAPALANTAPTPTDTAPAASVPPHPAAPETKPPPQIENVKAAAPPPVPAPSSAPPPQPVPPPKPASIPVVAPVAVHNATPTSAPSPPQKTADFHAVRHAQPRHLQPEHARTASRAVHLRPARDGASPAPRQSDNARALSPPPDQTQSFNQLLSQLTGQTRAPDQAQPARQFRSPSQLQGQSLTPPSADQPDPFARR